jgi:hypothetical protein
MAGMLVADGGRAFTNGEAANNGRKLQPQLHSRKLKYLHSLLMSTRLSAVSGSPFMGSVPFSAIYFSIKRRSYIEPETVDTTGCSGVSLLTEKRRNIYSHIHFTEV